MMKAVVGMGRKKTSRPFKDVYDEWIEALRTRLLPNLQRSMLGCSADQLSNDVQLLHRHFLSLFHSLDLAATTTHDLSHLLHPSTCRSPFLWLADFHPYLFTNLLRSFGFQPSTVLLARIDQIHCGLRLLLPSLADRARKAQARFVHRVGVQWARSESKQDAFKAVAEAVEEEMDLLLSVFLDANRLRRSVLTEILGAIDVYQAALFLEALARFYVGFRDGELVREFEHCKLPLSTTTTTASSSSS